MKQIECRHEGHGFDSSRIKASAKCMNANANGEPPVQQALVWLILIGINRRSCLHLLITSVSGDSISCEQLRQIDVNTMCLKYSPVTTCDRISLTGRSLIL